MPLSPSLLLPIVLQPFRQPGQPTLVLHTPQDVDPVEQAALIEQVCMQQKYFISLVSSTCAHLFLGPEEPAAEA